MKAFQSTDKLGLAAAPIVTTTIALQDAFRDQGISHPHMDRELLPGDLGHRQWTQGKWKL